jgi:hypothetical protein
MDVLNGIAAFMRTVEYTAHGNTPHIKWYDWTSNKGDGHIFLIQEVNKVAKDN